jgi:hypothetical protein
MAKDPKNILDEEELIHRRDDVAYDSSADSLSTESRRALADARLRALAFALEAEPSRHGEDVKLDDSDLLAYLLDSLPPDRRLQLEGGARGDAALFGRLMTLHSALNSATDRRDRSQADNPARKIPRRTAGRIDIRSAGRALQFKDANITGRQTPEDERIQPFLDELLALQEYLPVEELPFRKAKRPQPRPSQKAKASATYALQRASRSGAGDLRRGLASDFGAVMSLVQELESLLTALQELDKRAQSEPLGTEVPDDNNAQNVRRRLIGLLPDVRMIAERISEQFSHLLSMMTDMAGASRTSFESSDAVMEYEPLPYPASLPDLETWSEACDVAAGPWTLHLSGRALPRPELAVALRGNSEEASAIEPFLTMVQPARGFELVNLDTSGSGKVALPNGESVMLVQGDEVWEIRLAFRSV